MDGLKLFILTVVLFLYLLFGAVVFHFLESNNENETRYSLHDIRQRLLWNHSCLTEEALENFVKAVVTAREAGITIQGNQSSPSNWDFSSSFFFSGTVVTTIGYGSISPRTFYGQLMCMVYAALGIPLTAWLLASVGASYQMTFQRYVSKAENSLEHFVSNVRARKMILWILVSSVSYTAFLIFPSLIFTYIEDWSFHVAHYYSFITLTTIGFGDYLATLHGNDVEHWIYDFAVTIWNILGLAYLATLISVIRKGEMKTAKSFRKFHAKIVKRHKLGKENKERKISGINQVDLKCNKKHDGKAMYSKSSDVEETNVIFPCLIQNSTKDLEKGQTEKGLVESDQSDGMDKSEDEVIDVEGKIIDEDDNMCIMLECENENDFETAERALQAALNQNTIITDTRLSSKGSFSIQHHMLSNQLNTAKLCKTFFTQGTQT